jgi:hypothetical protein
LCLVLTTALMLMQRSFRWFIAGLTLLVLSVMPVAQVQHGWWRVADTLLVGCCWAAWPGGWKWASGSSWFKTGLAD